MFHVHSFGSLRVLIDEATGAVVAVQDRATGAAASLNFSPAYIARAKQSAVLAFESQYSEV